MMPIITLVDPSSMLRVLSLVLAISTDDILCSCQKKTNHEQNNQVLELVRTYFPPDIEKVCTCVIA